MNKQNSTWLAEPFRKVNPSLPESVTKLSGVVPRKVAVEGNNLRK